MADRIELPSGAWVEFRDPRTVTYGDREPIERVSARAYAAQQDQNRFVINEEGVAQEQFVMTEKTADPIMDLALLAICALTIAWSYEKPDGTKEPLPSQDQQALRRIPAIDVDLMRERATELMPKMFLDREPTPEPSSPSTPSPS